MADSKMIMLRILLLLSFACCSSLAVRTSTSATKTTSSTAPSSISTRRQDLADAGGGGGGGGGGSLCLHKVSTQAYDGVLPSNDGSGRLLFWNTNGLIWLAAALSPVDDPTGGSSVGVTTGNKPLLDLRSRISPDAAARGRGLAGVALHSSGLLLVSYYTTAVDADGGNAAFLVVDQLPVSLTTATTVFSMRLPDQSDSSSGLDYYSGQILFRPTTTDQFFYLVTGPAQGYSRANILRVPLANAMATPTTEVYASVGGVPRRCAFDTDRPQDLYCAILKDQQAQVYLISDPDATPPSPSLLDQRPTQGRGTSPSQLVGGLLYRGHADTTLAGSYIYMDGSKLWVTSPARNPSTTGRKLRVTCSSASGCGGGGGGGGGGDFAGGVSVTSFGEDAGKNAILLATNGVYLIVQPNLCDAATNNTTTAQAPTSSSDNTTTTQAPTSNKTKQGPLSRALKVIGSVLGAIAGCYGLSQYKMIFQLLQPLLPKLQSALKDLSQCMLKSQVGNTAENPSLTRFQKLKDNIRAATETTPAENP